MLQQLFESKRNFILPNYIIDNYSKNMINRNNKIIRIIIKKQRRKLFIEKIFFTLAINNENKY